MDESQSAAFVAKLDAFAETLSLDEQALLTELVSDGDDDVAGFSAGWPGLRVIVPMFGQSGGDPKIFRTEDSFAQSGGDPKIFRSRAVLRRAVAIRRFESTVSHVDAIVSVHDPC